MSPSPVPVIPVLAALQELEETRGSGGSRRCSQASQGGRSRSRLGSESAGDGLNVGDRAQVLDTTHSKMQMISSHRNPFYLSLNPKKPRGRSPLLGLILFLKN